MLGKMDQFIKNTVHIKITKISEASLKNTEQVKLQLLNDGQKKVQVSIMIKKKK